MNVHLDPLAATELLTRDRRAAGSGHHHQGHHHWWRQHVYAGGFKGYTSRIEWPYLPTATSLSEDIVLARGHQLNETCTATVYLAAPTMPIKMDRQYPIAEGLLNRDIPKAEQAEAGYTMVVRCPDDLKDVHVRQILEEIYSRLDGLMPQWQDQAAQKIRKAFEKFGVSGQEPGRLYSLYACHQEMPEALKDAFHPDALTGPSANDIAGDQGYLAYFPGKKLALGITIANGNLNVVEVPRSAFERLFNHPATSMNDPTPADEWRDQYWRNYFSHAPSHECGRFAAYPIDTTDPKLPTADSMADRVPELVFDTDRLRALANTQTPEEAAADGFMRAYRTGNYLEGTKRFLSSLGINLVIGRVANSNIGNSRPRTDIDLPNRPSSHTRLKPGPVQGSLPGANRLTQQLEGLEVKTPPRMLQRSPLGTSWDPVTTDDYARFGGKLYRVVPDRATTTRERPIWNIVSPDGSRKTALRLEYTEGRWQIAENLPGLRGGTRDDPNISLGAADLNRARGKADIFKSKSHYPVTDAHRTEIGELHHKLLEKFNDLKRTPKKFKSELFWQRSGDSVEEYLASKMDSNYKRTIRVSIAGMTPYPHAELDGIRVDSEGGLDILSIKTQERNFRPQRDGEMFKKIQDLLKADTSNVVTVNGVPDAELTNYIRNFNGQPSYQKLSLDAFEEGKHEIKIFNDMFQANARLRRHANRRYAYAYRRLNH